MQTARVLGPISALLLAAFTSAEAAPALPIEQAVAIANSRLKERGFHTAPHIVAITLQRGTGKRGGSQWFVQWSDGIAIREGVKEVGVNIGMDGSLTSIVKGPTNRDPVTGKFDPNGPSGLQNHRTRADRPSILNLKH